MVIDDAFERFFYETECMKCNWNVRELRRQIKTNLYVRAGISKHPELLIQPSVDNSANTMLTIKDPFTFEFLGLEAKDAVSESDLEQALMDHLQEFMLELGEGFCFEARQKRIIIDDKYYFIDLVFYNRLLHCNVIIELKNDEFKHEDLGQLNAYVGYYKKNEMMPGDNPPVGILLCTDKGSQMVEYALSGMDNQLFVSTYMQHLPDKRKLQEFMLKEMEEMGIQYEKGKGLRKGKDCDSTMLAYKNTEISELCEALTDSVSPKKIYLFGSFAKGTESQNSDIDLYLVMPDGSEEQLIIAQKAYEAIRRKRKRPVDIVVGYESEFIKKQFEPTLEKEVIDTGIVLYEQG